MTNNVLLFARNKIRHRVDVRRTFHFVNDTFIRPARIFAISILIFDVERSCLPCNQQQHDKVPYAYGNELITDTSYCIGGTTTLVMRKIE